MNERSSPEAEGTSMLAKCSFLRRALDDCHRRLRCDLERSIVCRHMNRSLAECIVSAFCPEEVETVRSLCSSAATALKRSQCRSAQLELSVFLASNQEDD